MNEKSFLFLQFDAHLFTVQIRATISSYCFFRVTTGTEVMEKKLLPRRSNTTRNKENKERVTNLIIKKTLENKSVDLNDHQKVFHPRWVSE